MSIILFLICFVASTMGAVAGFGGGVIIKPVVDMFGILPVDTVSFLSSCTVLSMAVVSLLRSRGNGVKLETRTSTPLALGSVAGGLAGKWLFELVKNRFQSNERLGAVQTACLLVVLILVFAYICQKSRLKSFHVTGVPASVGIGLLLGMMSCFLGIGGGPYNVAVLFLFYSMDTKAAAKNSIYIILFSQISSVFLAVCTGTVPEFSPISLALMIAGGIGGALLGAQISKRITSQVLDKILRILVLVIIGIVCYNFLKFTILR